MPKVFLVRKLRNQPAKGNGTFGTVTPPPSPEQEGLVTAGQAAVQNTLPSSESHDEDQPKDLVVQRRVPEKHEPMSPSHDDDHDRSRSPSHWSESTHNTPPVSPNRLASPIRPMSPQPLREEDISSSSKSNHEVPSNGQYRSNKQYTSFSSISPRAVRPTYFPVSVIKSPHDVAPTGSRARYAYEKYAERSAEARASLSPVASHFYDSGSESCSAVSPRSYASNEQIDSEGPLDFRSHHNSRSLSPHPLSYRQPIRIPESIRQVISPETLEFVNGGAGIKNPLVNNLHRNSEPPPRVSSTSSACHSPTESYKSPSHRENRHADSNSDNHRLNCNICGKSFSLQRLLNRHMKCHSDQKRYMCTFCGKGFNDTFDLKRHTRTHTGVRPYKCMMCDKSFTQRCSLESHTLKVHGIQHNYAYKERRAKVYVCEECGHTTNEPEVHYLHLKENHPFSPALLKFYDKRHFKFSDGSFPLGIIKG